MTSVSEILTRPELGPEAQANGSLELRYEDVAQDGRLQVSVLSAALGATVWAKLARDPSTLRMRETGQIPILTRLVLGAGEGPISVAAPLETTGAYRLAHGRLPSGEVERIYVEMWGEARAPEGHTFGPPPGADTKRLVCGRLYAEHVLTRLFAPKGERKVRSLEHPTLPAVPGPAIPIVASRSTFELPAASHALPEWRRDVAFSLSHTDSNQHVSSLVYLRFAEDAAAFALRDAREEPLSLLSAELAYGKPSFAGDVLSLVVRLFEATIEGKSRLGVTCAFVEATKRPEEGRTFARLVFR